MSALLLIACSAAKAGSPRRALDLYQGVMYQTLREHMPIAEGQRPAVMIVSAEHGLISPEREIAPYDRELTTERADELMNLDPVSVAFPGTFNRIFLAGGVEYRRLMRWYIGAMHEQGLIEHGARVEEVSGGIGEQRHQLGTFLRSLDPVLAERDRVNNYANDRIKEEQINRAEGRP
jgi:hypothetical protein